MGHSVEQWAIPPGRVSSDSAFGFQAIDVGLGEPQFFEDLHGVFAESGGRTIQLGSVMGKAKGRDRDSGVAVLAGLQEGPVFQLILLECLG